MTLAFILRSLIHAAVHTGNTFRLPFCQSNVIHPFFCDIPSLLKLSWFDTFSNEMVLIVCGLGIVGGCLIFIISSYSHMFSTVFKFPRGADRKKAFSTCVPNIFVVSVFLSSGVYVYLRQSENYSTIQDIFPTFQPYYLQF